MQQTTVDFSVRHIPQKTRPHLKITGSLTAAISTNKLDIKHVYFKPKGNCFITAMANFVNIKFNNPKTFRLPNTQNITGKYYYGFKRIKTLNKQIPLSDITRYPSNKFLRNDVPGVCLINDPF